MLARCAELATIEEERLKVVGFRGLELELEHLLDNDFFDLANNGASEMLIGILDEPSPRSLC